MTPPSTTSRAIGSVSSCVAAAISSMIAVSMVVPVSS